MLKPVVPTRQVACTPQLKAEIEEIYTKTLESRISLHRKTLEKFTTELMANPLFKFSWSLNEFMAAAELQVLKQVKVAIRQEGWKGLAEHRTHILTHILQKAEYLEGNWSGTSNIAERCELAALAKFYNSSTFSVSNYETAPINAEKAEIQRLARQIVLDANYNMALANYNRALANYKASRNGEPLPYPPTPKEPEGIEGAL